MESIYLFLACLGKQRYFMTTEEKIYLLNRREEILFHFGPFLETYPEIKEKIPYDTSEMNAALGTFLETCSFVSKNENNVFNSHFELLSEPKLEAFLKDYSKEEQQFWGFYSKQFYDQLNPISSLYFSDEEAILKPIQRTYSSRPYRSSSVSKNKS